MEATFGERLRKIRRDNDITQNNLAEYLGIKGAAVAKYENQEEAYPNIRTLIKIADYFNVSIDWLLTGRNVTSVIKNSINSSSVHNSIVQSNIQGDNGGVFMGKDMSLSPQAKELLRIYEVLGVKEQTRLMSFAYELEEKLQSANQA